MDLNQIKYLTDQQKERYITLERLFDNPGWLIIEELAQAGANEQLLRAANAANWDHNRIATGARAVYLQLLNFRESTENEFVAVAQAAQDQQELKDVVEFE